MEENTQPVQHIMLYYFKKGNATETICAVYGEGAVTDQSQKWLAKLHADFSLDNALQWGRPVEVDSDQIEALIENSQRYTTWEIADILKIPKSTQLLVKMKKMCLFT